MTRAWDEFVAVAFDLVGARQLLLIMVLATAAWATLWYWFPAWVPRRLPRWRAAVPRLRPARRRPVQPPGRDRQRVRRDWRRLLRWRLPRWRLRRRPARTVAAPAPTPSPVPAAPTRPGGPSAADLLAAQGRYAEAIRERLREVVTDLVRAGVVAPQPGWTAAELAVAAASARPSVQAPLDSATALFAEIWYGERRALAAHDQHMRELADQVRAALRGVGAGAR